MSAREERPCPICAEMILVQARKCRFCGEWISDESTNESTATRPSLGSLEEHITTKTGITSETLRILEKAKITTLLQLIVREQEWEKLITDEMERETIKYWMEQPCEDENPEDYSWETRIFLLVNQNEANWKGAKSILNSLIHHEDPHVRKYVASRTRDTSVLQTLILDTDSNVAKYAGYNSVLATIDSTALDTLFVSVINQVVPELPTIGPGTLALLRSNRIRCLGDLLKSSDEKLLTIPSVGPATVAVLREWQSSRASPVKSQHFTKQYQQMLG